MINFTDSELLLLKVYEYIKDLEREDCKISGYSYIDLNLSQYDYINRIFKRFKKNKIVVKTLEREEGFHNNNFIYSCNFYFYLIRAIEFEEFKKQFNIDFKNFNLYDGIFTETKGVEYIMNLQIWLSDEYSDEDKEPMLEIKTSFLNKIYEKYTLLEKQKLDIIFNSEKKTKRGRL